MKFERDGRPFLRLRVVPSKMFTASAKPQSISTSTLHFILFPSADIQSPSPSPLSEAQLRRANIVVQSTNRRLRWSLRYMNTMSKEGSKPLGFLDLPAELRQRVYSLAFASPKTPLCAGFTRVEQQPVHMYCTKLSSQLLRTCSTVYNEAHPLLFSQNSFLMQEASEFTTLKQAAGDDLSSVHQLCFQSSCKITEPRIKQLKKFDGLETVVLSYDGLPIYGETRADVEDAAVQCVVQQFQHLALLIAARPDVQYILKAKHARQGKEVTLGSS